MTILLRGLVAAFALCFTMIGGAPAAHAADPDADTRPCVANREVNGTPAGLGRTELERRWEVTGLGARFDYLGLGNFVFYPWCDHPTAGTNGDPTLQDSWVAIRYGGETGRVYTG